MNNSALYESAYSREIQQSLFQDILSRLGGVTVEFVPRSEYINEHKDDFLVQTGQEGFGEQYDLFLPDDISYIELFPIIDALNTKFGIEDNAQFDELLVKTKTAVVKFLRDEGEQDTLDTYIQKSGISPELQDKIAQVNLMKNRGAVKEFLGANNSEDSLESLVADLYGKEFEKVFFRQGVNMLRLGMMTFTQNDAKKLEGKRGLINERVIRSDLDLEERKLRDVLQIDSYKNQLKVARDQQDEAETSRLELEFCNILLGELLKYPYQGTENTSASMIGIGKEKEMQCLGFSILVHAILEELGISHQTAPDPGHIKIGVQIGKNKYTFDPSVLTCSPNYVNESGTEVFFRREEYEEVGDVEAKLLSFLYTNRGLVLSGNGDILGAVEMYEKAIKIFSENLSAYRAKGSALCRGKRFDEAITVFEDALELWEKLISDVNEHVEKRGGTDDMCPSFGKDLSSDFVDILYELGKTYFANNQAILGKHEFDTILQTPLVSVDILNKMYSVYVVYGGFESALDICERILILDPKNIKALQNMCSTYSVLGDRQGELNACDRILEIDPRNIKALQCKANIYAVSRNRTEEISTHNRITRIYELEIKELIEERQALGSQDEYAGAGDEEQQFTDKIKKITEGMTEAYYSIGLCYYFLDDYDNAIKHYESALLFNKEHKPSLDGIETIKKYNVD